MEFTEKGLTSLKFDDVELLGAGDFRVDRVLMRHGVGHSFEADLASKVTINAARQEVTRTFPWGTVRATYELKRNHLGLTVVTTNKSSSTIHGVFYEPLVLKFPTKVQEYDGSIPLLGHNVGNPTVITLSHKKGVVVLVNEDVRKPLLVGYPWALDKPANTTFPVRLNTDRDPMLPDMLPYIDRAIPPGGSDEFKVSLRFGAPGTSALTLADDVLQRFAQAFPSHLKWKDKRPIGTVFLATAGLESKTNPRGWLLDRQLDVTTPEGRETFKKRIFKLADETIAVLRDMNAQGMITWDIEGQEHPRATYAGDPRMFSVLAPEMTDVADEYFKKFRDAGFRVGVCVRPQEVVIDRANQQVYEKESSDPGRVLLEKIAWAKSRWQASLFYIDSNGEPSRPLDAEILQKIAHAHPDVLLVPEHKNVRYYSFSAPYMALRDGYASTPSAVRSIYPTAFSLVNTAEGPIERRREDLVKGIKQGDILLYRSWYDDPANVEVKGLY
jgi:hypothetical protein